MKNLTQLTTKERAFIDAKLQEGTRGWNKAEFEYDSGMIFECEWRVTVSPYDEVFGEEYSISDVEITRKVYDEEGYLAVSAEIDY